MTDKGYAVAADFGLNAYVTGYTNSASFQGAGVIGTRGGDDVFATKFSPSGSLTAKKIIAGSGNDYGYGIAVHPNNGRAIIVGQTASGNFPTASPIQTTLSGRSQHCA